MLRFRDRSLLSQATTVILYVLFWIVELSLIGVFALAAMGIVYLLERKRK